MLCVHQINVLKMDEDYNQPMIDIMCIYFLILKMKTPGVQNPNDSSFGS